MKPSAREVRKLVHLLAAYILTDGARIQVQDRAYRAYRTYFEALEARYPRVGFRMEESQKGLVSRAQALVKAKVFRGPGATL